MSKCRTILITLLAVATLAVLAACGSDPAPQPAAVATAAPAQTGANLTEPAPAKEESATSADATDVEDDAGEVSMTTGQGKTLTLSLLPLTDSRDYIYCELLFIYGELGADIYSTSPLAECLLDWWDKLDLDALAQEFGAESVGKNGSQWWSMDEVRVMGSEPVAF